ncbi:hypothetical protein EKE94_14420 [Mesobaculum littorinae]|uniref:Uncharacterized protein n=1 Tax=Mesobaculum littorinae TaxID=2486419 RepID=A0A438AEV5_9RHOB|nr:hypothetical protein [Mesobaculum littorinae]RVV97212.1 hypothetical protein EKE94_14420 [Mesobaculum littorinae]
MPYQAQDSWLGRNDFLRKTQCDAGRDWKIALSALRFRGGIRLRRTGACRLDDVMFRKHHHPAGRVTLEANLHWHATTRSRARPG